jgi:hypothetical protein
MRFAGVFSKGYSIVKHKVSLYCISHPYEGILIEPTYIVRGPPAAKRGVGSAKL